MGVLCKKSQLALLREKLRREFPGSLPAGERVKVFPTGVPGLDGLLEGGLPRGGVTEVRVWAASAGGQTLLMTVLDAVTARPAPVAIIDRADAWDFSVLSPDRRQWVLWVRCRGEGEAVRATDLLVRDGNFPLVVMDLRRPPGERRGRSLPSRIWYRLQRGAERSGCALVAVTGGESLPCARLKLSLRVSLSLEHLEALHERRVSWESVLEVCQDGEIFTGPDGLPAARTEPRSPGVLSVSN